MSLLEIKWKPERQDLRSFGIAMLVGFGLLGLLFSGIVPHGLWEQNRTAGFILWAYGGVSGLLSLLGSRAALPFYWLWMGFAFVMGNTVSRLVLILLFYGVVTPLGCLSRLLGRDALGLKRRSGESYWRDLPEKEDYQRQF